MKTTTHLLAAAALSACALTAWANPLTKTECIAPAKPGGGFDLTCKLAQSALYDGKFITEDIGLKLENVDLPMLGQAKKVVITKARKGDLHSRRQILGVIQDTEVVTKLFDEVAPRYAERPGGYTRIVRVGNRRGDNAEIAVIELV